MPLVENDIIARHFSPPVDIAVPPALRAPMVLSSPHSGNVYPDEFLASSKLDALTLRKSEDCYVDNLFGPVARDWVPFLAARFPRAYLDVNREPYELDPRLFGNKLPDYANAQSTRVIGGLGTIARIVADGEEIYATPPTLEAALARIEGVYQPYHRQLKRLLSVTQKQFGYAILLDCHSMPSMSISASQPGQRPDIVLGDRFGASCSGMITNYFKVKLAQRGYSVHVNRPYAGGYITEHYGRPRRGVHALQMELNRGLYVNEQTLEVTTGFSLLRDDLVAVCQLAFSELPDLLEQRAVAE